MKHFFFGLFFMTVITFGSKAQEPLFSYKHGDIEETYCTKTNIIYDFVEISENQSFVGSFFFMPDKIGGEPCSLVIYPLLIYNCDLVDTYFSFSLKDQPNPQKIYFFDFAFKLIEETGFYPKELGIWSCPSALHLDDGISDKFLGKLDAPTNSSLWKQRLEIRMSADTKYLKIGPIIHDEKKSIKQEEYCEHMLRNINFSQHLTPDDREKLSPYIEVKLLEVYEKK